MGRLGRREALEPTGAAGTGGGAISGGEEVLGLLRRLYEDAHQQLDRDGDVERAAWVLAELLREPDREPGPARPADRVMFLVWAAVGLGWMVALPLALLVLVVVLMFGS